MPEGAGRNFSLSFKYLGDEAPAPASHKYFKNRIVKTRYHDADRTSLRNLPLKNPFLYAEQLGYRRLVFRYTRRLLNLF